MIFCCTLISLATATFRQVQVEAPVRVTVVEFSLRAAGQTNNNSTRIARNLESVKAATRSGQANRAPETFAI